MNEYDFLNLKFIDILVKFKTIIRFINNFQLIFLIK